MSRPAKRDGHLLPAAPPGNHLAAIVESSDDAILSKDPAGRIMSWNPAATRMYGWPAEEVVGKPISVLIPPNRAGEELRLLERVLAGERVENYETERVRKDGTRILVSLTVSPVRDAGGEILGASVIARDVTGRVRTARLATRLQGATADLSRAVTPQDVIAATLEHTIAALMAEAGTIGLVLGDEVVLADNSGHPEELIERWRRFPLSADVPMAEVIRTGEALWSTDAERLHERYGELSPDTIEHPTLVLVPMRSGKSVLGAIWLSFGPGRDFEPEERAMLGAVAQQAAYALERAKLYERQALDAERQAFLSETGALLAGALDPDAALTQLAELAVMEFADVCGVHLLDDLGDLRTAAATHTDPECVGLVAELMDRLADEPSDRLGPAQVVRTGKSLFEPDGLDAATVRPRELLDELDVTALSIVPLQARGRVLGALTFATVKDGREHEDSDLLLAQDLGRRAGLTVDNALLFRREHEAALTLQRSLLPHRLPVVPGLSFDARYEPAAPGLEVGGDWYEVVPVEDGTVGLTIGDVAGRGVHAASIMGWIRPALAAYVLDGHSPREAISRLDRTMRELDPPQMTTVFHMHYDPARGIATYVRAGHPPALIRRPDGTIVELDGEGTPPLGILLDIDYAEHQVEVPPGSLVLLYTDGLIERRQTDLFAGLERLRSSFAQAPADPAECVEWLATELRPDDVPDDVAMLVMATSPDRAATPLRRALAF